MSYISGKIKAKVWAMEKRWEKEEIWEKHVPYVVQIHEGAERESAEKQR